jgi:hypothetical protein
MARVACPAAQDGANRPGPEAGFRFDRDSLPPIHQPSCPAAFCSSVSDRAGRMYSTLFFASILLMNVESPAYVKDQLGHSSIKITVDVYGHFIPGANQQAVNRLPTINAEGSKAAGAI